MKERWIWEARPRARFFTLTARRASRCSRTVRPSPWSSPVVSFRHGQVSLRFLPAAHHEVRHVQRPRVHLQRGALPLRRLRLLGRLLRLEVVDDDPEPHRRREGARWSELTPRFGDRLCQPPQRLLHNLPPGHPAASAAALVATPRPRMRPLDPHLLDGHNRRGLYGASSEVAGRHFLRDR
jgi:hypothetical protein